MISDIKTREHEVGLHSGKDRKFINFAVRIISPQSAES